LRFKIKKEKRKNLGNNFFCVVVRAHTGCLKRRLCMKLLLPVLVEFIDVEPSCDCCAPDAPCRSGTAILLLFLSFE